MAKHTAQKRLSGTYRHLPLMGTCSVIAMAVANTTGDEGIDTEEEVIAAVVLLAVVRLRVAKAHTQNGSKLTVIARVRAQAELRSSQTLQRHSERDNLKIFRTPHQELKSKSPYIKRGVAKAAPFLLLQHKSEGYIIYSLRF